MTEPTEAPEQADLELIEVEVDLDPEEEPELILPVWEPTGEPRVDAALDLLVQLDEGRLDEHAAVFEEVHRRLRQCLADLDVAQQS